MKKTWACLAALLLAACGSGGNAQPSQPVGETSPANPTAPAGPSPAPTYTGYGPMTTAETELVGTDANGNGVRDDVDAIIVKTYIDPTAQKRIVVYAQWLTWTTIKGLRKTPSTEAELTGFGNAVACAYRTQYTVLGEKAADSNELRGQLLNTFARTRSYLTWDASTSGLSSTSAMDPCASLKEVSVP